MGSNENASPKAPAPPRPPSVTHWMVGLSGVCGFAVALAILLAARPFSDTVNSMFLLLIGLAGSISAVDLLWGKVHKRPATGLDFFSKACFPTNRCGAPLRDFRNWFVVPSGYLGC